MSHVHQQTVQRSETKARRATDDDGAASAPLPVDLGQGVGTTSIQAMLSAGNTAMIQLAGGGDGDTGGVHQAAASGIHGGGGRLPHAEAIQRSFGGDHDVSGVQAHVGGRAAQANQAMGAEAYATGNHIAFAKSPDLHTAAHEAAHVVQQRAGVSLSGGVGKAGDSHEQHADAVADRVVAGKPAGDLLAQYGGGGGGGAQGVQHKKGQKKNKKKNKNKNKQQTPPQQTTQSGGTTPTTSTTTSSTTTPTTTTAPQQEGGAKVSVAESAAFEFKLGIPIYGPVKLEGSVQGSYTTKDGDEGQETEIEGMLYGGIAVDLYIIKVSFGIEGKVKFAVEGVQGIIDTIKRGVHEIAQWKLAKDFSPRLANLRTNLTTAYASSRKEFLAAHKQVIEEVKENYKSAGNTWWLSKSPRALAVWHQNQWNKALQREFSGVGAEVAADKLIDIAKLEELYDKIREAPSKAAAMRAAQVASSFGVSQIDKSNNAAMKAVDDVQVVENDPSVGFEASIAFKAGLSVQATSDVAGEFTIASVTAIEDKKGEKTWDTSSKSSTVVSGKVAVAGFEGELVGDFKEDEIEISAAFKKEQGTAAPEAAQNSVQSVMSAVQQGGYSLLQTPLDTVKAVGSEVGKVIQSNTAELLDPKNIEERLGGKMNGSQGVGIEVKLKFKRPGSLKPVGGSVKISVTAMKLDAEKALGKTASVGVSGSVSMGKSFEASWGG